MPRRGNVGPPCVVQEMVGDGSVMLRMRLLDRYIIREMLTPLLVALGGFVILLVGHMLWTMVQFIVEKHIPLSTVVRFVLFHIPWALTWALPASALFACAMAVNRLSADGELAALRTSGVRLARILAPTFAVGLAASIATFAVDEFLVPWANTASENLATSIRMDERAFALAQRRFLEATPNDLVYVQQATEDGAEGLLAFRTVPNGPPWMTIAGSATLRDGRLRITDPVTYIVTYNGDFVVMRGAYTEVDVRAAIREYWRDRVDVEDMSLRELIREQRRIQRQPASASRRYRVQMHWAIALPASCLAFVILAGPMTLTFSRGGSLAGPILALAAMCVYFLLKLWSDSLARDALLPPAIAAWWQNALFAGLGLWLLWRGR